jgi:3',5'-cyclic AMP phosphodiesterase CpdA
LLLILFVASCTKDQFVDPQNQLKDDAVTLKSSSPKIEIAVISDIHYLDPSLMPDDPGNNPDFQKKMSKDRKLIELSDPVFRKVVSELISEKPDILLITGDMASEGELLSHETVKGFLKQIENEGIKVYVVPGNNDINNTESVSYKSSPPAPVPNINQDQFVSLYGNFGYNEALYRDVNSLSYICQPCSGLWILGIDAIKYSLSGTSGAINPATMTWIQEKMAEAKENNITVLAMMHYGIIEHYAGQKGLEPLIKNSQANAMALMNAGIRLIFTGHYHANDIVDYSNEGKTLTDIETGSLVTPPSPYRIMTLDDNFIKIDTRRVTDVESEATGDMDFLTYSDVTIDSRVNGFFSYYLPLLFGLSKEQAEFAAPYLTNGYKAYFAGDEKISPEESNDLNVLAEAPYTPLLVIAKSFWTDLPPDDNKIHIKLK